MLMIMNDMKDTKWFNELKKNDDARAEELVQEMMGKFGFPSIHAGLSAPEVFWETINGPGIPNQGAAHNDPFRMKMPVSQGDDAETDARQASSLDDKVMEYELSHPQPPPKDIAIKTARKFMKDLNAIVKGQKLQAGYKEGRRYFRGWQKLAKFVMFLTEQATVDLCKKYGFTDVFGHAFPSIMKAKRKKDDAQTNELILKFVRIIDMEVTEKAAEKKNGERDARSLDTEEDLAGLGPITSRYEIPESTPENLRIGWNAWNKNDKIFDKNTNLEL